MAHFAKIENGIVTEVIVVNNEALGNLNFPSSEPIGIAFLQSLYGSNTTWKETSYNGNFRGQYAGVGMKYDPATDKFLPNK